MFRLALFATTLIGYCLVTFLKKQFLNCIFVTID